MNIDEQIRVLVKEELDKQLVEIRDQIAGLSSRIDEVKIEHGKQINLILRLRKHALDELMVEYSKIKEGMHQTTEEHVEI